MMEIVTVIYWVKRKELTERRNVKRKHGRQQLPGGRSHPSCGMVRQE